jgi:hypothetical protein
MSSSGLRLDRRRARIKIVKPDILSLVIIDPPGLAMTRARVRLVSSVCASGTSLSRAFATAQVLNRGWREIKMFHEVGLPSP